jgi:hypothetical protein
VVDVKANYNECQQQIRYNKIHKSPLFFFDLFGWDGISMIRDEAVERVFVLPVFKLGCSSQPAGLFCTQLNSTQLTFVEERCTRRHRAVLLAPPPISTTTNCKALATYLLDNHTSQTHSHRARALWIQYHSAVCADNRHCLASFSCETLHFHNGSHGMYRCCCYSCCCYYTIRSPGSWHRQHQQLPLPKCALYKMSYLLRMSSSNVQIRQGVRVSPAIPKGGRQ